MVVKSYGQINVKLIKVTDERKNKMHWPRNPSMNIIPKISSKRRVVLAFLLVPWLPLLIAVPYAPAPNFVLFGWDRLYQHLLLCVMIAVFTYLLEAVALVPLWSRMLRAGKTSLLRILTLAILVAFMFSVIFVIGLFGPRLYLHSEATGLILIMCLIGGAEALVFWLIVRPDKHDRTGLR